MEPAIGRCGHLTGDGDLPLVEDRVHDDVVDAGRPKRRTGAADGHRNHAEPGVVVSDGKTLVFTQMDDPQRSSDIYALSLDGDRKPRVLLRTKFSEDSPKLSPNGA